MIRSRLLSATALAVGLVVAAGHALAGQDDSKRAVDAKAARDQRIEGVVIRVEPVGGDSERGAGAAHRVKLTINTAAVWRDYVRDTATTRESTPEKAARKGEESVATKGQPRTAQNLVAIEVTPESRLELRYRGATDERSLGAATAEQARRLATRDADPARGSDDPESAAEGKSARLDQIKPGLFIHVRYRRADQQDRADRVIILEPVRDTTEK
jgi:hypothetical protein